MFCDSISLTASTVRQCKHDMVWAWGYILPLTRPTIASHNPVHVEKTPRFFRSQSVPPAKTRVCRSKVISRDMVASASAEHRHHNPSPSEERQTHPPSKRAYEHQFHAIQTAKSARAGLTKIISLRALYSLKDSIPNAVRRSIKAETRRPPT
jgi:hypothetical protein